MLSPRLALGLLLFPWIATAAPTVRKVRDLEIYADSKFHAAFPSVIRRPDGEVIVAFRRAPNRLAFGEAKNNHVDPNSQLVLVRSSDGQTWTSPPELLHAHALVGSQDPCLLQLRDGTVLCMSYGWAFLRPDGVAKLAAPFLQNYPGSIFSGGYYLRSTDGGRSWAGPLTPPHITPEILRDPYGKPLPAYNRGALVEAGDGRLHWVVAATENLSPHRSSTHLLTSTDRGQSWTYTAAVAADPIASFNETSLHVTPRGDLVAFLRSERLGDEACFARSTDGGRTFQPWQRLGFRGHPLHALRLPDDRVLLTYGYRHPPYGIRARILNPECTDASDAPEIILRDDGGTTDLGYPWSVQLDATRVLVTYYFNTPGRVPFIAGTLLVIE